jgi:uncharacterized membrane protein YfhO
MYLLVKELGANKWGSLASAAAFMFSGFFLDEIWWGHETVLSSITWIPLIFLFFFKAYKEEKSLFSVLGGIFLAVQLYSGHPQFVYYGMLALFVFMAFMAVYAIRDKKPRKTAFLVASFFIVGVIGLGLYSLQLLPAAELSHFSVRAPSEEAFDFFTRWSMEPKYIISFIFPKTVSLIGANSFPFPVALGYIGFFSFVLALLSLFFIRNRFVLTFWGLTVFSLLLSIGRYTPIYRVFYHLLPGFNMFRNPIFYMYLYVFSICILTGFGMHYFTRWIKKDSQAKTKIIRIILIVTSLAFLFISLVSYLAVGSQDVMQDQGAAGFILAKMFKFRETLVYDFARIGILMFLISVPFFLLRKFRINNQIFKGLIILVIFMDLFLYGKKFISTYDLKPFVSKGEWVDFLKRDKEPFRVMPVLDYPEQDPVMKIHKISSINGYGSLEMLQDYVDFIAAFQEVPVTQQATLMRVMNYNSIAVDLLNMKYILTDQTIEDDRFPLIYSGFIPAAQTWDPQRKDTIPLNIYENKSSLPRGFIVHAFKVEKDRKKILNMLQDTQFDPKETVILEEELGEEFEMKPFSEGKEQVEFIRYRENEILLEATLEKDGILFLSEIYYPGWKVYVDGEESKIYRANYLFRSVYLEKGIHTVKLIFRPDSFKRGAFISLLFCSILLVYFGVFFLRRKNKEQRD